MSTNAPRCAGILVCLPVAGTADNVADWSSPGKACLEVFVNEGNEPFCHLVGWCGGEGMFLAMPEGSGLFALEAKEFGVLVPSAGLQPSF